MSAFIISQPIQVKDGSNTLINPAAEDGHLATIDTKLSEIATDTDNLDAALSTRAADSTLQTTNTKLDTIHNDLANVAVHAATFSRNDTFTTTGAGVTVDSGALVQTFSMTVIGTGAVATLWTVTLQISLDGTKWTDLLQSVLAVGDGVMVISGTNFAPSRYFRSNVAALTLGTATNIKVYIAGL